MPAKTPSGRKVIRGGTRGDVPPRPDKPIDVTASYTLEEAAAHLQVSKRAVGRLIEAGRLSYLAVNQKNRRVLGRHILDFQERQSRSAFR